jgi:4-amino-4-deoxy-L-arabinose transferase-like glycosyltransferase
MIQLTMAFEPNNQKHIIMTQTKTNRTLLKIILIVALGIRLAASWSIPQDMYSDSMTYDILGHNISQGLGFTLNAESQIPSRARPPGYPTFLAAIYTVFGHNIQIALLIQALLGTVTVYLAYAIGNILFKEQRVGLVTALIVALYPGLIYYDSRLLREGLCTFLFTLTIYMALQPDKKVISLKRYILTGLSLAFLSAIRPEMMLLSLPIFFILAQPLHSLQQKCKLALIFILPILLIWIPWTARNYIHFGSISPVSAGIATTVWFGTRWASIGGEQNDDLARKALRQRNDELTDEAITSQKGLAKNTGEIAKEVDLDKRFSREVWKDLTQRPHWFAGLIIKKMYFFWRDANGVTKTLPRIHWSLPYLLNTYYYTLLGLSLFCIIIARKNKQISSIAITILTFMMIYALLHVRNRYRIPTLPIVFVLSAGGFWALYDQLKHWILNRKPTTS